MTSSGDNLLSNEINSSKAKRIDHIVQNREITSTSRMYSNNEYSGSISVQSESISQSRYLESEYDDNASEDPSVDQEYINNENISVDPSVDQESQYAESVIENETVKQLSVDEESISVGPSVDQESEYAESVIENKTAKQLPFDEESISVDPSVDQESEYAESVIENKIAKQLSFDEKSISGIPSVDQESEYAESVIENKTAQQVSVDEKQISIDPSVDQESEYAESVIGNETVKQLSVDEESILVDQKSDYAESVIENKTAQQVSVDEKQISIDPSVDKEAEYADGVIENELYDKTGDETVSVNVSKTSECNEINRSEKSTTNNDVEMALENDNPFIGFVDKKKKLFEKEENESENKLDTTKIKRKISFSKKQPNISLVTRDNTYNNLNVDSMNIDSRDSKISTKLNKNPSKIPRMTANPSDKRTTNMQGVKLDNHTLNPNAESFHPNGKKKNIIQQVQSQKSKTYQKSETTPSSVNPNHKKNLILIESPISAVNLATNGFNKSGISRTRNGTESRSAFQLTDERHQVFNSKRPSFFKKKAEKQPLDFPAMLQNFKKRLENVVVTSSVNCNDSELRFSRVGFHSLPASICELEHKVVNLTWVPNILKHWFNFYHRFVHGDMLIININDFMDFAGISRCQKKELAAVIETKPYLNIYNNILYIGFHNLEDECILLLTNFPNLITPMDIVNLLHNSKAIQLKPYHNSGNDFKFFNVLEKTMKKYTSNLKYIIRVRPNLIALQFDSVETLNIVKDRLADCKYPDRRKVDIVTNPDFKKVYGSQIRFLRNVDSTQLLDKFGYYIYHKHWKRSMSAVEDNNTARSSQLIDTMSRSPTEKKSKKKSSSEGSESSSNSDVDKSGTASQLKKSKPKKKKTAKSKSNANKNTESVSNSNEVTGQTSEANEIVPNQETKKELNTQSVSQAIETESKKKLKTKKKSTKSKDKSQTQQIDSSESNDTSEKEKSDASEINNKFINQKKDTSESKDISQEHQIDLSRSSNISDTEKSDSSESNDTSEKEKSDASEINKKSKRKKKNSSKSTENTNQESDESNKINTLVPESTDSARLTQDNNDLKQVK